MGLCERTPWTPLRRTESKYHHIPSTTLFQTEHAPKPILLNTGEYYIPFQWHPVHVDTQVSFTMLSFEPPRYLSQVLRIGQLLIAAAPGEFTTMAGRWNPGSTFSPPGGFERRWLRLGRRSALWCWRASPTRTLTTSPPGRNTRHRGLSFVVLSAPFLSIRFDVLFLMKFAKIHLNCWGNIFKS